MSVIAVLSINYKLAEVKIREKVAFEDGQITNSLLELKSIEGINACAILSTCNRSEVYVVSDSDDTKGILINYLSKNHNIAIDEFNDYVVYLEGEKVLNYICNVATGLDSLVLGEPQILGQLKHAYNKAKEAKTLDKILGRLFQHTFSTAKKVRTQTKIGSSPVSIAYCAVKLSEKIFTDLSKQTVLLIGAGEMIELCAKHLSQQGVTNIIIANRTIENAKKITDIYDAKTINFRQFPTIIDKVDIIISCTAASVPIIGKGMIETAIKLRKRKPIFIFDIAIPRDVEPEVSQLQDVFLYTIDDLQQVVNNNMEIRQKEKKLALDIIVTENKKFNNWLTTLPNEQIVQFYNKNAYLIKNDIIEIALNKLKNGIDSKIVVKQLADQLTNKLLHTTNVNVKQLPQEQLSQCENCIPNINTKK
jgi:glutamyl-tRNA reductase